MPFPRPLQLSQSPIIARNHSVFSLLSIKTDKELRKTDELLRKTVCRLNEVGHRLGSIGINLGNFAEELFYTSLKGRPELVGIHYDIIKRNIMDDNRKTEYDILMFNGDSAAIVEVKYKAHL